LPAPPDVQQRSTATVPRLDTSRTVKDEDRRAERSLFAVMPPLCNQRVETRLGDEVGDNGTRLPAPSLDVRGPLAWARIARAGVVARPDKAEVSGSSPLRPTHSNTPPTTTDALTRCVDVSGRPRGGAPVTHNSSVRRSSTTSADGGSAHRARRRGGRPPRLSRPRIAADPRPAGYVQMPGAPPSAWPCSGPVHPSASSSSCCQP
jgi:hypothetical protein